MTLWRSWGLFQTPLRYRVTWLLYFCDLVTVWRSGIVLQTPLRYKVTGLLGYFSFVIVWPCDRVTKWCRALKLNCVTRLQGYLVTLFLWPCDRVMKWHCTSNSTSLQGYFVTRLLLPTHSSASVSPISINQVGKRERPGWGSSNYAADLTSVAGVNMVLLFKYKSFTSRYKHAFYIFDRWSYS